MTVHIVTGLCYGDEGKGGVTDYLARQGGPALVVRHNGGPQAGHNVVTSDGKHHEFSQFGSGTLAGADTFLSEYMLINPLNMKREAQHLIDLGQDDVWSRTYVDHAAKIITPMHIEANRIAERTRGAGRHGSCGQGVGAAMKQHLTRPDLTIHVRDLARPTFETYFKWNELIRYLDVPKDVASYEETSFEYRRWYKNIQPIVNGTEYLAEALGRYEVVVFEGAQGVLLDEWRGFHPYTTWSTTTPHNARVLLNLAGYTEEVEELGVTRAYMTRHGAGPFVTESPMVNFDEPHNNTGQWQGEFRQGNLDLVALDYAIRAHGRSDKMKLVVTHLDRADYWSVVEKYALPHFGDVKGISLNYNIFYLSWQEELTSFMNSVKPVHSIQAFPTDEVLEKLSALAPIAITSYGPTADDKKREN